MLEMRLPYRADTTSRQDQMNATHSQTAKVWDHDEEKELWNQALDAAIVACIEAVPSIPENQIIGLGRSRCVDAIRKLYAPIMDEPRDQY